jgi:hypothetical protein
MALSPFTFTCPTNNDVSRNRVFARRTRGAISATVLDLIDGLDDEAWSTGASTTGTLFDSSSQRWTATEAVLADRLPAVDGLLFCRWGNMWRPEHLLGDDRQEGPDGVRLLPRRDYSQIWLHQFLRVKVLRYLFRRFPEAVPEANVLDPLKHQVSLPADHRLYVVETNLAVFGESTSRGRVTRNCAASLTPWASGFRRFTAIDEDITMGVIERDDPSSPTIPVRAYWSRICRGQSWPPSWLTTSFVVEDLEECSPLSRQIMALRGSSPFLKDGLSSLKRQGKTRQRGLDEGVRRVGRLKTVPSGQAERPVPHAVGTHYQCAGASPRWQAGRTLPRGRQQQRDPAVLKR